jgi:predicted nucleotidyltransferase component of viral defense system
MASEGFLAQVRLLMRVLPLLGTQEALALKDSTAINLFVQNLPRLSVDIDLAYIGLEDRDEALARIHAELLRMKASLEALGLQVQPTVLSGTPHIVKLVVWDRSVQIKVEVSPVLRGTVYPPERRQPSPEVQARFGFAEVPVLALPDLYAGKLVAALDRQHPRDQYDLRLFLQQARLTREVVLAFLVYLVSHGRPLHEVLRPRFKDIRGSEGRGELCNSPGQAATVPVWRGDSRLRQQRRSRPQRGQPPPTRFGHCPAKLESR